MRYRKASATFQVVRCQQLQSILFSLSVSDVKLNFLIKSKFIYQVKEKIENSFDLFNLFSKSVLLHGNLA